MVKNFSRRNFLGTLISTPIIAGITATKPDGSVFNFRPSSTYNPPNRYNMTLQIEYEWFIGPEINKVTWHDSIPEKYYHAGQIGIIIETESLLLSKIHKAMADPKITAFRLYDPFGFCVTEHPLLVDFSGEETYSLNLIYILTTGVKKNPTAFQLYLPTKIHREITHQLAANEKI